jgi:cytidylate kinase
MTSRELIVAIDGPSAAGKSTAGTRVAKRLGYLYVESGAFYRALAWKVRESRVDPTDNEALRRLGETTAIEVVRRPEGVRIMVDQGDVTEQLRTPEMSRIAAQIASNPIVREPMLKVQRAMAKDGGVVMEGRDIGTVVFPEADVKFYLDADTTVRGERRYKELRTKGVDVDLKTTIDEIVARDRKDMTRAVAPLRKAQDAIAIDSTGLTLDEVVDKMVAAVEQRRTAISR